MPRGSMHDESGLLRRERGGWMLYRDDGGRWRLDLNGREERVAFGLDGLRVRVRGRRVEFDLLDVDGLESPTSAHPVP